MGACMCLEFTGRYKTLHNYGQPGCKHEAIDDDPIADPGEGRP